MLDKLKKNYFLLIVTFLFIYFFFNLLDGDRGLISNLEKKEIYNELKIKENNLKIKIKNLEHKNSLLTDNCLLYTSPSPRDVEESRMPSSA